MQDYLSRTVIPVGTPAAGGGFTRTFEESEYWLLLAVTLQLVTDATVGNRNVVVALTDGAGGTIVRTVSGFAQTPSSTANYSFARSSSEWDSDLATVASGPLFDIPVAPGDSLVVSITGAGAADQMSAVRLTLLKAPVRDDD